MHFYSDTIVVFGAASVISEDVLKNAWETIQRLTRLAEAVSFVRVTRAFAQPRECPRRDTLLALRPRL